MKKIILPLIIMAGILLGMPSGNKAQIHVQINIGAQPVWGPAGYDYAEYYYMPDIDVFFNIPRREYIFLAGGRWVFSPYLPDRCRDYDLYRGYKVVINEPSPWLRYNVYHEKYAPYRGWYGRQVVIRDSRDPRYHYGHHDSRYDERYNDYRHDRWDYDRYDGREKGHGNRGRGHNKGHGRGRW